MSILCATDFSAAAVSAADVAAALAKRLNQPLRLVHCARDWVVAGEMVVVLSNDAALRARLEAEAARLRTDGLEVNTELRSGVPHHEILATVAHERPAFLVLGSVGDGNPENLLIGSVAERVAESAPVPTLLVRKSKVLLDWLRGTEGLRLLCGVDRTASSDAAIAGVVPLVALGEVEIEAASVLTEREEAYAGDPEVRQRDVWERVRELLGDGPVQVHVRDGAESAVAGFLEIAEEREAGLLVVGTHQRHGLDRLTAPSFSRAVMTHAKSNVLCVPAAAVKASHRIPKIRRVLVPTNFSEAWPNALRHAYSLLPGGGSIHIVHVCPAPRRGINPLVASAVYFDHSLESVKAQEEAEAKLRALPEDLLKVPEVTVTWEVIIHDHVAATLCAAAERAGADVICMESKGISPAGAFLGSTVLGVLRHAHKPVFVVTPPLP